jgi:hypothetical protein
MTYKEFIIITGWSEVYMTYEDYTNYIEPVYNDSDLDKHIFCKALYKCHEKCVYTPVNMAISAHSIEEKEAYLNGNTYIMSDVEALHESLRQTWLKALASKVFQREYKLRRV